MERGANTIRPAASLKVTAIHGRRAHPTPPRYHFLAADVVGFSRLMEADEFGTLRALKSRHTHVLDPLVARHQGRIFKVTGDGVLVEFGSAVNALQCAVDLQQAMAAANGDQSNDRAPRSRVGINLGDVMVEGGDLYGDGVNIAARWKPSRNRRYPGLRHRL